MKFPRRTFTILSLSFMICLGSCSEYQQVVKSGDYYLKFNKAKEYFEKEQYYRAMPLFDELISYFKGTNLMQDILYYYAYCHYETGEYLVAGFHFKNYASTYPSDPRAEECLFMNAKSFYQVSPKYMLEQSYTQQCIDAIQLFANSYPESKYIEEANAMMDEMRGKLEKKAFYNAELYLKMGKYKAATTSFENMLRDYPDSEQAEQAMFLALKSNYLYAQNSIFTRQEERYEKTVDKYRSFSNRYRSSPYQKEAQEIYESSLEALNKIRHNE